MKNPKHPTRRDVLKTGFLVGAGLALGSRPAFASLLQEQPITRAIPSSGERLPVVGLGTNNFSVTDAEEIAARREVIRLLPERGGSVVDTARGYGRSEIVIGDIVRDLGNRDRLFIATKLTAPQNDLTAGMTQLREAFERLQVDTIDLMMVHNLNGTDVMMPVLREWKENGRIRYYGVSTSSEAAYPRLLEIMRAEPMDFIQVDYSIGNRGAADQVLPLAQDRGMAVMLNVPFGGRGGRNLFPDVQGRPLPDFAADIDAATWAQFFLKYNISHPAVTVAIPGTTQARHLEDNVQAAFGRLPDEALRRRMEQYWDSLT
jgi:aryl-alcohol dehydrogenase-like predicted oxidoreductase